MKSNGEVLLPLPEDQWSPALEGVLNDMGGAPINVHKLMAHNADLLNAWWNFRNHSVDGGSLGRRFAELVILRVGMHLKAWYEWGSHVDRSLRCGLALEEINRVQVRSLDGGWTAQEAALLRAVDELVTARQLSSDTKVELARHFSTAQVLDIIAIHGMYVILGCMINTWGLALDAKVAERISAHTTEAGFNDAVARFHGG